MAVGACGFSPQAPGAAHDAAAGSDVDAFVPQDVPDAPPGQQCFGSLAIARICYRIENLPAGPRTYMVADTINTDSGVCDANAILPAGNPCVIAAGTITLTGIAALHVIGARPLVLVATEPGGIVMSAGTILDASSVFTQIGAGTSPAASCTGSVDATAKAGGFGGTFVALGGNGGDGDGDTGHGTPAAAIQLTQLRGGCPGGSGGGNNTSAAPGGGAIALVATTITINGLIAVGGAGGHAPGNNNHGGNGGGAGGLVVLDAVALAGGGEVDAKGGGGGEGTGGLAGLDGTAGYNFPNRAAESLGGSGDTSGGDGGRGGPQTDLTRPGADGHAGSTAGGGGGGGAAGVILVTAANVPAITFEPAPQ